MVYLGYGLIAVVAILTVIVSVREFASRENLDLPRDASSPRLVLHSTRRLQSTRRSERRPG